MLFLLRCYMFYDVICFTMLYNQYLYIILGTIYTRMGVIGVPLGDHKGDARPPY